MKEKLYKGIKISVIFFISLMFVILLSGCENKNENSNDVKSSGIVRRI